MVAGAVATVLGTPVVAAWNARSAMFSIVAPDSSPAVATVTWKLTVALPRRRRERPEPHHHPAAGELAGVVAGRVGQRRPVQLDAPGDELGALRE